MIAEIRGELCTGCGLCPETCPEVFSMNGDTAKAIKEEIPAEFEECSKQAADECPVNAISILN